MIDIYSLLDRLAGRWLDWHADHGARRDEMAEFSLKKFDITDGSMNILATAPVVAVIADQAAAMLDKANAKNYLSFDMMPRLDRGLRPIRVTVAWANGENPATKAARLEDALRKIASVYDDHDDHEAFASAECEEMADLAKLALDGRRA